MAEFEEKLNSILENHEAMEQIMSLARSLSGGGQSDEKGQSARGGSASTSEVPPSSGDASEPKSAASDSSPDLSSLLGQIDPGMLQMGMRLFQEYQGNDGRNAALLAALRPFLKEDRRAKLDRALEIARVTRLIRVALGAMGGKGEEGRV
ncbi:MAG: hypothetical protein VB071_05935 [Lawsonibacter sp.]|nr:hypothetical protein [Lawsonibacter sp.]